MKNIRRNRILRFLYYCYKEVLNNRSYCRGSKNSISNFGVRIKTRVQIKGHQNCIQIEKGALLKNVRIIVLGDNNTISINKEAFLSGTELWVEGNHCKLNIGQRTFIGPSHIAVTEQSDIIIGCDCMLSSHVQIRSGDSHSILSKEINPPMRINHSRSIFISDHVWLGEGAKVLKGVTIETDSIVSTGAIVTSSFEKNVLVGGIPAKVLKNNVTWDKQRL